MEDRAERNIPWYEESVQIEMYKQAIIESKADNMRENSTYNEIAFLLHTRKCTEIAETMIKKATAVIDNVNKEQRESEYLRPTIIERFQKAIQRNRNPKSEELHEAENKRKLNDAWESMKTAMIVRTAFTDYDTPNNIYDIIRSAKPTNEEVEYEINKDQSRNEADKIQDIGNAIVKRIATRMNLFEATTAKELIEMNVRRSIDGEPRINISVAEGDFKGRIVGGYIDVDLGDINYRKLVNLPPNDELSKGQYLHDFQDFEIPISISDRNILCKIAPESYVTVPLNRHFANVRLDGFVECPGLTFYKLSNNQFRAQMPEEPEPDRAKATPGISAEVSAYFQNVRDLNKNNSAKIGKNEEEQIDTESSRTAGR